jgi:phosphopantetheine adenylyltransferase
MSQTNLDVVGIKTVFVTPRPTTRGISSRSIRETLRTRGAGAVVELVPAPVAEALAGL